MDAAFVKQAAVRLSMRLHTSMEFFLRIPLCDLADIIEEVAAYGGK